MIASFDKVHRPRTPRLKTTADDRRILSGFGDHAPGGVFLCNVLADLETLLARVQVLERAGASDRFEVEEILADALGSPTQGEIPELRSGDPAKDALHYTGGYGPVELAVLVRSRMRDLTADVARLRSGETLAP